MIRVSVVVIEGSDVVGDGQIAQRIPIRVVVAAVADSPRATGASRRGQSLEVEEVGREEVGRGAEGDVDRFVVAAGRHYRAYLGGGLFGWMCARRERERSKEDSID